MTAVLADGPSAAWLDALRAARLLALAPDRLAGIRLKAGPGPARDKWLETFRNLADPRHGTITVPLSVGDERLLGGVDVEASVLKGRLVTTAGLLSEARGHTLLIPMAERWTPKSASRLAGALDLGSAAEPGAAITVIAFDESCADEEPPPAILTDRLGLFADLSAIPLRDLTSDESGDFSLEAARELLPSVTIDEEHIGALVATADALAIGSLRAVLFAVDVARANAALDGRSAVTEQDCVIAVRLALLTKARAQPGADPDPRQEEQEPPPPPETQSGEREEEMVRGELPERILTAATATLPQGVLDDLARASERRSKAAARGHASGSNRSSQRGRPAGIRRGEPGRDGKLSLPATILAAVPWQKLRRSNRRSSPGDTPQLIIRRDDFRVVRREEPGESLTIFAVDASGSTALNRLREAKGAVELLLAQCYIRREKVALVAFRGKRAELLLAPTRSLARARRLLSDLPGGGGTPLADGVDVARGIAEAAVRAGKTALLVVLTDGQANIDRAGTPGRPDAIRDALSAARLVKAARLKALLLDTSPHPAQRSRELADAMGARYLPMPLAGATAIKAAVERHTARG